jgi:hypothetical protein
MNLVKRVAVALALTAFAVPALACSEHTNTASKEEQKPKVAKAEKKDKASPSQSAAKKN